MLTKALPILLLLLAGCISSPKSADLEAHTAAAPPHLAIWAWYIEGPETTDVVVTPLSDLYLNTPSGPSSTFHFIWNGTTHDDNGNPVIISYAGPESDPACPSDTIGYRFQFLEQNQEIYASSENVPNCGQGFAWLVGLGGGHLRSERSGHPYTDFPYRLELDNKPFTCPRDSFHFGLSCGTVP